MAVTAHPPAVCEGHPIRSVLKGRAAAMACFRPKYVLFWNKNTEMEMSNAVPLWLYILLKKKSVDLKTQQT